MRIWTDPRNGGRYEVRVLITSPQVAFWSDRGFRLAHYERKPSIVDLTDVELIELLDEAKPA